MAMKIICSEVFQFLHPLSSLIGNISFSLSKVSSGGGSINSFELSFILARDLILLNLFLDTVSTFSLGMSFFESLAKVNSHPFSRYYIISSFETWIRYIYILSLNAFGLHFSSGAIFSKHSKRVTSSFKIFCFSFRHSTTRISS